MLEHFAPVTRCRVLLVTVAEEVADPLGPEFQHCADEMNFGLPFREAMHGMLKRFPLQDLHFLISAILVQRETGGNLAELLDKAAAVLRSRITLQQKVRVHTAQGRMTGGYLDSAAFIAFVLLNLDQARLYGAIIRDRNWSQIGLRYID